MRLAWRAGNVLPALVASLPRWQRVTARLVHLCFYALMFALPVTGWLMSSAGGFPVSFLGLFDLPDLIVPSDYRFRGLIAWKGFEIEPWLATAAAKERVAEVLDATAPLRAWLAAHVGGSAEEPRGRRR